MKTKPKAASGPKAGKQYNVTNGKESRLVNDPSNARRMAKRLNEKRAAGEPEYTVEPYAPSTPTVAALQKAVDKASAQIKSGGKAAKAATAYKAATSVLATIVADGMKLALVRKSTGAVYARRKNRPGAIKRLLYQAQMCRLEVENATSATKLEAA